MQLQLLCLHLIYGRCAPPPDNPVRWVLLSSLYRDGHQAQRSEFLKHSPTDCFYLPGLSCFHLLFNLQQLFTECQVPCQPLDSLVSGKQRTERISDEGFWGKRSTKPEPGLGFFPSTWNGGVSSLCPKAIRNKSRAPAPGREEGASRHPIIET